ncbi:MAG: RCC1 domain-containing protein [bacterium]|nr:hypothetical protein [Acidimicrobiia bacterium]MCY4650551.1 RCC1 domain-containing protein [bacterium]
MGNNDEGEANPPQGTFNAITAGWDYTCGRDADGKVTCWGLGLIIPPPDGVLIRP